MFYLGSVLNVTNAQSHRDR